MKQTILQTKQADDAAASTGKTAVNPLQLLKDKSFHSPAQSEPAQLAAAPEEELPVMTKLIAQREALPEEELT
jgi:hypothetical protein